MSAESAGDTKTEGSPSNRRAWIITVVLVAVFFFIIQDVVGYITGGGIFSVASALAASNAKLPIIDVDGAGLRSAFMIPAFVIILGGCAFFNIDMRNRLITSIVILLTIGGSFVIDGCYDEIIMTRVLAGRGYTRCENRDHDFGNGKSKVWFHNYVLNVTNCPATRT